MNAADCQYLHQCSDLPWTGLPLAPLFAAGLLLHCAPDGAGRAA